MKTSLRNFFVAIFSIAVLAACTKSNDSKSVKHEKDDYRVQAIGQDTTTSIVVRAREQTVGLLTVEDDQLKAELLSYTPLPNGRGQYVIKMTNKQDCQSILRWSWDGLTIDNTTPDNDVLTGNQSVTYTLIGDAKPGRIKVKSEKSNSTCTNSSTLILEITMSILPIKYTDVKAKYDEHNGYVTLSFSLDDPTVIDYFVIEKFIGGEWKNVYTFTCDKKTKSYSIPIFAQEK